MKAKKASETLAVTTKVILPNDTNTLGNLFGGQLMAWMDMIASVSAHRHSRRVVVTASVNNVSFNSPINHASIVTLEAKVSRAFNSSMEVFVDVYVEDNVTGKRIRSNEAMFTFVALWTGALWGKPTWGTWWAWDARMTSELILLFLYFGFMALQAGIDDARRADRAGAVLALVGVINIPIIYFSVKWWNTLHQGASVSFTSAPTMAATMFAGMFLMALAAWMYTIAAALHRVRSIIIEREQGAEWLRNDTGTQS